MHIEIPKTERLPIELLDYPLPIDKILYEAETPIIYMSHTKYGQSLLAYLADESEEGIITLLAPVSDARCKALDAGYLSVREVLDESWLWFHFDKNKNEEVPEFWAINTCDIPNDFLPLEGTPLLPEHEAVFRMRAIGKDIAIGKMPLSVVAFVADAMRSALKTLLDFTLATSVEGRPKEDHRALYDLPIQRFAFNSFELSFAAPNEGLFLKTQEAVEKLESGLVWAASPDNDVPLSSSSDEERATVLRATSLLTPPTAGAISEIEISGSWIKHGHIRLTHNSRKKVNKKLRVLDKEKIVTYGGRIGEIDDDNLSFTLRDVSDENEHKGFFEESILDDMKLYYYEGIRVTVAGRERRGRLYVAAIAPENFDAD